MRPVAVISLSAVLCLSACLPKKVEVPMVEVPAGPLIQALELRRQSFTGLKAAASIRVERKSRKRTLDTVALVLRSQNRLRMEAYGPLGQSMMALVWNGQEAQLRLPDKVINSGPWAMEKLLGSGVEVKELCAALSGNIPEIEQPNDARAFCASDGACVLELRRGETLRRVRVLPVTDSSGQPVIASYELSQGETLVFRARFEQVEAVSHYRMPMKIVIENPEKKLKLTVTYSEVEVNIPVSDDLFQLSPGEVGIP